MKNQKSQLTVGKGKKRQETSDSKVKKQKSILRELKRELCEVRKSYIESSFFRKLQENEQQKSTEIKFHTILL